MEATIEKLRAVGGTDYVRDVLPDLIAETCEGGDRAVRRLCDHVGADLVDGYNVYLMNFGSNRTCGLPDVGGWYLYDSSYATYLEVELEGCEVPEPARLESSCDLDYEGCFVWNSLVPQLSFLARCLQATEEDAWKTDEQDIPLESWDRWLSALKGYHELYRLACERAVRAVVTATDSVCAFWDSDEGEETYYEEKAA